MTYPPRENLEVFSDTSGTWIRCARCQHSLCREGEEWRKACHQKTFPPTEAGPHFQDLVGTFQLQQLFCPSCKVLLNTDVVGADR